MKIKNGNHWGGFHFTSIRGDLFLWGDYRFQKTDLNSGITEREKSGTFSGEVNLYSKSYLFHPKFLLIKFNFGYAPGTEKNNFLVAPDRSDTKTAEKVDLGLIFFNNRPITLNISGNYNHSFINRELTSDVESWRYNFNSNLYFRTIIPLTLNYTHNNWKQNELQTVRNFSYKRNNITGRVNKNFSEWDENDLVLSYDDYYRRYENNAAINNKITSAQLKNRFFFNDEKNHNLNSFIWYYNQYGSQLLKRLTVDESITLIPFESLSFEAKYRYNRVIYPVNKSKQHYIFTQLNHKLYESLNSFINYEYTDFRQTFFNESKNWITAGFDYIKKIPTGSLRLGYSYTLRLEDKLSKATTQSVIDEEKILEDDKIVLLDNPFVHLETVVITDLSGTIIYQDGFDYLLISRGEFFEIKRVPGGQIPEGGTIYIDYVFEFKTDYNFTARGNNFSSGLTLFNNLLDFYFMYNDFSYSKLEGIGFNVLQIFTQKVFGARTNIDFFSAGFEYVDYKSNITPYRSIRYFVTINEMFFNKVLLAITANYRDYLLLPVEKQIYKDASGRITFLLSPFTKINLNINTRFQRGRQIDLDLSAVRAEFETRIRDITIKLGYEYFKRIYIEEKINYNNIYLRIGRYF